MTIIRVYCGVRSPYSRLGMHVIKRAGLKVEVIPFTGPPKGVPFLNPTDSPLKLSYIMEDAPRMTAKMGLKIHPPASLDPDYKPANLAQLAATRDGYGLDFACAIADARWGQGRDISDLDVLAKCAVDIGWDGEVMKAAIDSGLKEEVARHRQMIEQDGVFGVPFGVIDREGALAKYWGHDRFGLLIEDVMSNA